LKTESAFVSHEPCPSCASKDNLARYSDGHGYCFSCEYFETAEGEIKVSSKIEFTPLKGEYKALKARGITEETCALYHYSISDSVNGRVHVANMYNKDGTLTAQKLRGKGKAFSVRGNLDNSLFGRHLWSGGRKLVITEGEIDCLSVSQVQGNSYPVLSLPNGAAGAKKVIASNLEYLDNFEEIILMFDMDKAGRKASLECASILPIEKVKIAELPEKDANTCLTEGKGKAIINAIWSAVPYRPDGLVKLSDIIDDVLKPTEVGIPWFLPTLTEYTYGRRWGETYFFGAGTGVGKTDVFTQSIAFDIETLKEKVGVFYLEQGTIETGKRIAGKLCGKRFHVPDAGWTSKELEACLKDKELVDRITLYDSFGVNDWDSMRQKIVYLASNGVRLFYIDHLTALATGQDQNEREVLEKITADMASLAKKHQVIIHVISHLATPDGTPHEEGGRVSIRHFKGSRAIGFWAHFMFGMERDQQHEDVSLRQLTTFRVLKDRHTGSSTGKTIQLGYIEETGMLFEHDEDVTKVFTPEVIDEF
jgi:twinkle protein